MKTIILLCSLILAGCVLTGRGYGTIFPEGQMLSTSCISVRSFDSSLRSSPGLYGEDSFVGYIDYGPGLPRGHVFLILPVEGKPANLVGKLLQQVDPRHRSFWIEAKLVEGNITENGVFEAIVPAKVRNPSPNATIVEREAILIRGQLRKACDKTYLVAAHANPFASESHEWPILRKSYDKFLSSLQWPL